MRRIPSLLARTALAAALVAPIAAAAQAPSAQQGPQVKRTVLQKQALRIAGQDGVLALVEIPAGGREGRHTHPADVLGYVLEGTATLEQEGEPARTLRAGDSFFIPAGKIHEGINTSSAPARLVAAFVADQGKPLTTQVSQASAR